MKTKIKTKCRIAFCGVAAVFLLTMLLNFALARQEALAKAKVYKEELYDRGPGNSLALDATIIKSWQLPANYTSAQSFAMNSNDFVVIAAPKGGNHEGGGLNKVIAIDRSSKATREVALHDMGHGNGATWDNKRNQLLVVDGTNVYRFDENYNYIDTKSTLDSDGKALGASGIAYDNLHDQYWTSVGVKDKFDTAIRKVDKNSWVSTTMVKENHTQVNQDLAYYHGYTYRILWTGDNGEYSGRNGNFAVNSGVIMQFGDDGTFTGSYYMPDISCELESAAFAGGEMYLLYNNCGSDGSRLKGYYAIAKVENKANNPQLDKMYHRFNVKYDANGGAGAPSSYVTHVGIPSKISTTKPTRENYTFLGWSTNKNSTTVEFAAGSTFNKRRYSTINTDRAAIVEPDVTLYAVWQEQKYTVNYNANGGTGAPASQTSGKTQDITLSSTTPTRANYTFIGWSTSKTATTASYQPGDRFTNHENTTLYAVWRADMYTVRYNATGGTGAPAAQTSALTENLTISNTVPTRTYFDFLGWATSAGGSVAYRPGDTYTGRANVTLYAVWSAQLYAISFDANGGTGAPTAMKVAKIVPSVPIPATKPTRSGYIFRGWATSASATTVEYNIGDNYSGRSDVTLYAVWEDNSSTPVTTIEINYDANGGTNAPETTVAEPGNITLSSSAPKRDGYNFLGWATASNATTAAYQAGATAEFNVDTLLYAVWARSTITLSYDANGGTNAPEAHSGAIGEITIAATIPTREGYSFDGWAIDASESASYQPGDLYRGSVSRKLYAVWTQQTVNINYYFCKSVANPVSSVQKVVPMRRAAIPTGTPSRKAYRFLGWSTEGCTGTAEYDPGDSIYVGDSDVNLYAVWGDARFRIHFDMNGGSAEGFDDIIGDDDDIVIPDREPIWDGYEFKGWDENPEATTATYQPGDTISGETDMILYAVWEQKATGEDTDGGEDDPYDSDYYDEGDGVSPEESESKNPKTSASSLIGPISILPIGLISLMIVVTRRRRS